MTRTPEDWNAAVRAVAQELPERLTPTGVLMDLTMEIDSLTHDEVIPWERAYLRWAASLIGDPDNLPDLPKKPAEHPPLKLLLDALIQLSFDIAGGFSNHHKAVYHLGLAWLAAGERQEAGS